MPTPVETVIEGARAFLGERITTNATLREHHSHGQDTQPPVLPDAVAFMGEAIMRRATISAPTAAAWKWTPRMAAASAWLATRVTISCARPMPASSSTEFSQRRSVRCWTSPDAY